MFFAYIWFNKYEDYDKYLNIQQINVFLFYIITGINSKNANNR